MAQRWKELYFMGEDGLWGSLLCEQMTQSPCLPRMPLLIGGEEVGSVELSIAIGLVEAGFFEKGVFDYQGCLALKVDGASVVLDQVALWLRANGLSGKWRDEVLAVRSKAGEVLAEVERAVVRTLGIRSFVVRLVGVCEDGEVWLQRRALDKEVDAGRLDTLAGGLVVAGESLEMALAREVREETGLSLEEDVKGLKRGGGFVVHCPIDSDIGGYMVEECHWFVGGVTGDAKLENQDGEVSSFLRLRWDELEKEIRLGHCVEGASVVFRQMHNGKGGGMDVVCF